MADWNCDHCGVCYSDSVSRYWFNDVEATYCRDCFTVLQEQRRNNSVPRIDGSLADERLRCKILIYSEFADLLFESSLSSKDRRNIIERLVRLFEKIDAKEC